MRTLRMSRSVRVSGTAMGVLESHKRWEREMELSRSEREEQHEEKTVTKTADRPFDWVAALAFISGAAVMVPSLAALAVALLAVAAALL